MTDEEAPRDPVNCRGCLLDWIRETRLMLDAIEHQMDDPKALPEVAPHEKVHANGTAPH